MAPDPNTLRTGGAADLRQGPSSGRDELPDELVDQAVGRLRLLTLLLAGGWATAIALDALATWLGGVPFIRTGPTFGVVGIGLSIGIHLLARSGMLPPRALLDLGLVYVVLVALVISVAEAMTFRLLGASPGRPGVSWVCVWLVLSPLVVPTTTAKTLLTAGLAALTGPVGVFVAGAVLGGPAPTLGHYLVVLFPNLIAAGTAFLPSRIIHNLGSEIRRAERLGSYQLEGLIGSGGMGEVWRARHRRLARPAAVKLIRPEKLDLGDPDLARTLRARFEREALATAALQSPHTIQIYDFGVSPDGTFYYAMELLDGLDLQDLVYRWGPLPPARVARLLVDVCDSLAEAHERGLIHRDVKPANVFVCRLGREVDFVKVLDFGLVRCLGRRRRGPSLDPTITAADQMPGTPAYISPEMAGGDVVDHRADIYALGCVAYFLLSGELVFDGPNATQIAIHHLSTPPVPLRARARQPIPDALEALVMRCLAKRAADRPQTADELARLFAALPFDEPWTRERAQAWWRDHLPVRSSSFTPSTTTASSEPSGGAAPPSGVSVSLTPCGEPAG